MPGPSARRPAVCTPASPLTRPGSLPPDARAKSHSVMILAPARWILSPRELVSLYLIPVVECELALSPSPPSPTPQRCGEEAVVTRPERIARNEYHGLLCHRRYAAPGCAVLRRAAGGSGSLRRSDGRGVLLRAH